MKTLKIISPKKAETNTELGLVKLTKAICEKTSQSSSYGLGGEYGYGCGYENKIFMIHPFCWCDKNDCKWCEENYPNFIYKPTKTKIWWYKWIGRDQKQKGNLPKDWLEKCIQSIKKI
jgi:hypothetical protein